MLHSTKENVFNYGKQVYKCYWFNQTPLRFPHKTIHTINFFPHYFLPWATIFFQGLQFVKRISSPDNIHQTKNNIENFSILLNNMGSVLHSFEKEPQKIVILIVQCTYKSSKHQFLDHYLNLDLLLLHLLPSSSLWKAHSL